MKLRFFNQDDSLIKMAVNWLVSDLPRKIKRNKNVMAHNQSLSILIVVLVELCSIYSLTVASKEPNFHENRRNTAEKERLTLFKCNDSTYPPDWEIFMTQLDREQEMSESDGLTHPLSQEQFSEFLHQIMQNLGSKSFRYSAENSNMDGIALEPWSKAGDDNNWLPPTKLIGDSELTNIKVFSLQERYFQCPHGRTSAVFHWHNFWNGEVRSHPDPFKLSNMSIFTNGMLVWNQQNGERHIYKKEDYCILKHSDDWVTFKVCLPSACSDNSPCIRKCCLPSEVIDEKTRRCKVANPIWKPRFYRTAEDTERMSDSIAAKASVIVGLPNCQDRYMFNDGPRNKYILNDVPRNNFKQLFNGSLVQIWENEKIYIHSNFFCIDGFDHTKRSAEHIFQGSEWDQVVIACTPTETGSNQQVQEMRIEVYAILNFISAFFLLLIDLLYILIWKHQNNIYSWLQFSFATSLLFAFTCFAVNRLYSDELFAISSLLCKGMGWFTHLTYLSAYFWLTTIVFNAWLSRPLQSSRLQTQEKKRMRFVGFALFSIVIPSLISCVGVALDYKYMDNITEPPVTIPGFGKEKCYFQSKRAQIPYLYFPACILLLVDLIFFAATLLHIRKINTQADLCRTQCTNFMEYKNRVRVIAKLFIVMGVLWMLELFSWICRLIFTDPENNTVLMIIFTPIDCLNCSFGVLIFFILICQQNVTKYLYALFQRKNSGTTRSLNAQRRRSLDSSEL